jgi:ribosomal protein S18 acetylase RimI-like enzyme
VEASPAWLPAPRERATSWALRRAQYELWLAEPDAFALVAREAGRAVGYAMVHLGGPSVTWPLGERLATVETLAVLAEARGRGVGRTLLDGVRREARRRGADSMTLLVMEDNEAAQRFYEREGFRPFARLLSAPLDP